MNLSTTTLSKPQEVLSKGLNFAPTPTSIPVPDIIAAVECAAHKLKGDDIRSKVGGALRRFGGNNRLKPNLSRQQMKALKELKKNNDVVIFPADKGNTTVVMDRNEYDEKMKKLVETPTYCNGCTEEVQADAPELKKTSQLLSKFTRYCSTW